LEDEDLEQAEAFVDPRPAKVVCAATELRGTTPQKGRRVDTERTADTIAASTMPPAGLLSHPTLCTGRDPGIPHPPAAGATPEGEGSRESPASEVDGRSFSKIASRSTVEGERAVSRALVLSLFSGVSCEVIMKRYILEQYYAQKKKTR
jgi:hypothetical protein